MVLSYEEIRKIHREEKNSSSLTPLPENFLDMLEAFLEDERKKYFDAAKSFSVAETKKYENLLKMIEDIFSLREKKLLNKVLVSSRTGEEKLEGLIYMEKEAFRKISSVLQENKEKITEISKNRKKKTTTEVKLKILRDIPEFVAEDTRTYGPFNKEQMVSLPSAVAEFLVRKNFAEKV